MTRHATCLLSGTALVGTALLTACQRPLNESINPGPVPLAIYADVDQPRGTRESDSASLTYGHDRSHWRPQVVDVPVNQVEHQPSSEITVHLVQDSPRRRGAFPTSESAVQVDPLAGEQYIESGLNTAAAAGSAFWSPIRFVESFSVWNTGRSPSWFYDRLPPPQPDDRDRWYTAPAHRP